MLIYEVLKIRDFSKPLRLLFATPQKLLRDPPVGNHWIRKIKQARNFKAFVLYYVIYSIMCSQAVRGQMNRRCWDLTGVAVSEETRVGEVSSDSDRRCFPIFPVAWSWNGAWDWPTNVCKLQNVDQICVRWFGLLNFGGSVQCNLTHTCMLVCGLYLSDEDDFVCLCM